MQDTIILGNGTSKQIKTASLPNSYAEFKAMAENGNLYADIKLNANGCEVVGTPLNKQNLLTDETAIKWNGANNVDEALSNAFDIVEHLPIVFTSEIIFEGQTGNFTKTLDNFDSISVVVGPNSTDVINYMIPTKVIINILTEKPDKTAVTILVLQSTSITKAVTLNNTRVESNGTSSIRIYGHKAVIDNG